MLHTLTWSRAKFVLAMLPLCMMLTACSLTSRSDFGMRDGVPDMTVRSESAVDSTSITLQWTAPTTGTPVVYYELVCVTGQVDICLRNKRRINVPTGIPNRARVRGVDASGHAGPWSVWSDDFWAFHDGEYIDIDNPVNPLERR